MRGYAGGGAGATFLTLLPKHPMSKMALRKIKIPVVEKEIWVENRLGLHARPAATITATAKQYDATVTLEKDGTPIDARDMLALLTLDCPQGTRLVLKATGPQAREAATVIAALFARKFGES